MGGILMKGKFIQRKGFIILLCMVLILSMVSGCTKKDANSPQTTDNVYKSGTYTGEAEGYGGPVKVEVTISESEIKGSEIRSQAETEELGDSALNSVKDSILSGQTLSVDTVSGATFSSNAMLQAVEDAVKQAGGNVDDLKGKVVEKEGAGKVEELEADVVVVGAGASGVSAAVAAADKGAKVIIIEKTGVIGGASNLSWAGKLYNSSI